MFVLCMKPITTSIIRSLLVIFFLFGYFLLFLSDLLLAVTSLSPHMQMQKKHSNTKLEDEKTKLTKETKDQVKPLLTAVEA